MSDMVPRAGVEPARPCGHYALNVARLPFRHLGNLIPILIQPYISVAPAVRGKCPEPAPDSDTGDKWALIFPLPWWERVRVRGND